MTPDMQTLYPPVTVSLTDGARARIRPLSHGDGEALAALYASLPMDDLRFYGAAMQGRQRAMRVAADAASPHDIVLVLAVEHGIGGYAWYRWEHEGAARSDFGICIGPHWQGQGAGAALMTRLLEIARAVGPPVMSLTVQLANARALRLYTRMGFQLIREQTCARAPSSPWPPEPEYYMELRVR